MHIKKITWLILLLLIRYSAFTQDTVMVISPALYDGEEKIYPAKIHGWYFKQGGDTSWAAKDLDMKGWKKMRPVDLSVELADANGKVEGWFRGTIKIDSSFGETPLSLFWGAPWAAQDLYIDGKKFASAGNTGSNGLPVEENKRITDDYLSLSALKPGSLHTIAWHILDSRALPLNSKKLKSEDFGGLNRLIVIGSTSSIKFNNEQRQFYGQIIFGVIIGLLIFMILLWLLWILNREEKNILHFALYTTFIDLFFIIGNFRSDVFYSFPIPYATYYWLALFANLFLFLSIGYIPLILAIIFRHPLKKRVSQLMMILVFLALINYIFFTNQTLDNLYIIVITLIGIYIVFSSFKNAKGGDWAVIMGILLTLGSWVLNNIFIQNQKIALYTSLGGFFFFPLSLLIYVAIRFREMIRDIRANAEEVIKLSDEKRLQAEQQQEILEIQVRERTLELVHKNGELEIEAALQQVRSAANAMQKSDELLNVITIVGQQLAHLGIEFDSTNFRTNVGEKDWDLWIYAKWMDQPKKWLIPYFDHPYFSFPIKEGEVISNVFSRQEKDVFDAYLFQLGLIEVPSDPNIAAIQKEFMEAAKGFAMSTATIKSVSLNIANSQAKPYTQEENALLLRFAIVFEQAYTRFMDLQKAEAQAREAQIELGLERVRAKAMAMQQSNELAGLVDTVFKELTKLNILFDRCIIMIYDQQTNDSTWWLANPERASEPVGAFVKYHESVPYQAYLKAWKSKLTQWKYLLEGEEKKEWDTFIFSETDLSLLPQPVINGMRSVERVFLNASFNNFGSLTVSSLEPLSDSNFDILLRFAKVFDLTYTRFNDLQKAEALAREAQIELGLERVRARAMAMQHSNELAELVDTVFKELTHLHFSMNRCQIMIIDPDGSSMRTWMANPEIDKTPNSYLLTINDHPYFVALIKAWKEKQPIWIYNLKGEEKDSMVNYVFTHTEFSFLPEMVKNGMKQTKSIFFNASFNNFGSMQVDTLEPLSKENLEILNRFGNVFDYTYKRFNDLQKAEAQAREAQIETALEKVRSRTMAMQSSNELQETAAVLFREFTKLGNDDMLQVTIGIYYEDRGIIDFRVTNWAGGGDQENRSFELDMNEPTVAKPSVTAWKAGKRSAVFDLTGDALQGWLNYRNKISGVTISPQDTGGRRVISAAYFSKGHLTISTSIPLADQTLKTLERFAAVFDGTYTRFLDLQKVEAQAEKAEQDLKLLKAEKKRTEEALIELQITQKQLIQSEKMASLGELTAGIAHEIQNPLNFVNNFSEVSTELVDEMNEEIQKGNLEDAQLIAKDLKDNLEKINHHGKRAGDIVRGMLQHSRTSSGQKEPTDINVLADEYLRLAYHGLRAKDKEFNATLVTDLDPSIGMLNIIPQDMGRVILNLITNAFYAVSERSSFAKASADDKEYSPTVWVSTKMKNGKVEISIKDNGTGITQKVVDKIFQPFFTTKPTGQGTGLGLSLSYDIVKAHGGELRVETNEGEGSKFIISLPV